ncbi:MAG: hypothetical protein IJW46_03150 [Clostridia bacterium]|nr:hypothetical protein [Clostridia bacterium]
MAKTTKKKKKQASGKRRDPHERLTLKYWLGGGAVLAVFVGLIVLIALLAARADIVRFSYADGVLTREYDGRTFIKAPDTYETLFPLGNRYGKTDDFQVYKVGFYNSYGILSEMDSENYLTDAEGNLYYGNMVVLPTLDEAEALKTFAADTVRFGNFDSDDDGIVVYFSSLTNKNAPDATDFVNEYLKGKRYIGEGLPQKTYRVQLTSAKYDYLAYILYLVECDNGDFYLYSDVNRSSIAMDSEWFDSFHMPEETPDTTAREAS